MLSLSHLSHVSHVSASSLKKLTEGANQMAQKQLMRHLLGELVIKRTVQLLTRVWSAVVTTPSSAPLMVMLECSPPFGKFLVLILIR